MTGIPFKKEEMEVKYVSTSRNTKVNILNTPITPRENYLMALRGEKPLWFPCSSDRIGMTPRIIADNIARGFVFDCLPFDPNTDGGGPDMFGIVWEWIPTVGGSMVRPGSPKVEDITEWENYITFPDIDSWDWAKAAEENKEAIEQTDRLINITILNGMFERLISFIDMNEAMISLVDEDGQEALHRLFDKLADFYIKLIAKFKEYFHVDLITFHDDWGSQRAPFFSLDTAMEMLVPYIRKIADATHEMGIFFELHSCGKNEMLVPAYIAAHVDTWNGQPMNDKRMLAEKYGDKIIIGAAPTNLTKDSSPEETEETVKEFVNFFKDYNTIAGGVMGLDGFNELMYKYSRIALCGEAE